MLQNIEEALRRTPQDVLDARMQRHKRAMDLSMKHTALPKEMQEQQTPFEHYLQVLSPASTSTIHSRDTLRPFTVPVWMYYISRFAEHGKLHAPGVLLS